ncbi:glycosyltransferase family 4 protein [Streptomyces sp. 900105755]
MRIALLADADAPTDSDCSRNPVVLADELQARGHRAEVLTVSTGQAEATADAATPHLPCLGWNAPHGARIRSLRPDIVLSTGRASPVTATVLAGTLGIPLVLSLPAALFGTDGPPSGYVRLLCRDLPRSSLVVESQRNSATARCHGADQHRIFVVPPGVDVDRYIPRPASAAAPHPPKGHRPKVLLDITRTPPDDQRFIAAVLTRLGTERKRNLQVVVLAGHGPQAETGSLWQAAQATLLAADTAIPAAYAASDAVVVPGTTTDETLPALRAMAAGRPLVAADCPPNRDLVSTVRHGMLARPGRADEWLDKLDYLLGGRALRHHLGRGGRARAESHFSLRAAVDAMEVRLSTASAAWQYSASDGNRD